MQRFITVPELVRSRSGWIIRYHKCCALYGNILLNWQVWSDSRIRCQRLVKVSCLTWFQACAMHCAMCICEAEGLVYDVLNDSELYTVFGTYLYVSDAVADFKEWNVFSLGKLFKPFLSCSYAHQAVGLLWLIIITIDCFIDWGRKLQFILIIRSSNHIWFCSFVIQSFSLEVRKWIDRCNSKPQETLFLWWIMKQVVESLNDGTYGLDTCMNSGKRIVEG